MKQQKVSKEAEFIKKDKNTKESKPFKKEKIPIIRDDESE